MLSFIKCKKYNTYVKLTIFGISIKIKKSYSLGDVLYKKILFFLPERQRYYISGLFDGFYRWQWKTRYKKFTYEEIFKLFETYEVFPKNILSIKETIAYILKNKSSVARIGDGEELCANMLASNPVFPALKKDLLEICENGSNEKCLVCLNNFCVNSSDVPEIYRKHFTSYYISVVDAEKLKTIKFNTERVYGDAYAFLFYIEKAETPEERKARKEEIKTLWNGRKVCFVTNEFTTILEDKECFDQVSEKKYIFVPNKDAYSQKDAVMKEVEQLDKSWLIYLACGACATSLAYHLSEKGYQALDMGGYYDRIYAQDHSDKKSKK